MMARRLFSCYLKGELGRLPERVEPPRPTHIYEVIYRNDIGDGDIIEQFTVKFEAEARMADLTDMGHLPMLWWFAVTVQNEMSYSAFLRKDAWKRKQAARQSKLGKLFNRSVVTR